MGPTEVLRMPKPAILKPKERWTGEEFYCFAYIMFVMMLVVGIMMFALCMCIQMCTYIFMTFSSMSYKGKQVINALLDHLSTSTANKLPKLHLDGKARTPPNAFGAEENDHLVVIR